MAKEINIGRIDPNANIVAETNESINLRETLARAMTDDERRHKKILDEMADTFSKKNSDYGNAFEEILDDFGASYAVGRLKEKLKRLTQLVVSNKQEVRDESIEDTLLDMANYAVLTIMWLQKQEENK